MILLDVGADAVVPPAGKRSLILDADGVPFLLAPDGTRTEIGSGGGSGTITTAAPLSGDGSALDPATIADGALGLAKGANLAAGTTIGRATGAGTGAWTALTAAQQRTNLGVITPFHERMLALQASLATFTGKRWMQLGTYPAGVDIAARINNQTLMSGQGVTSDSAPAILGLTNNFIQTPKTLPWFIGFRAKVGGTFASTQFAFLGTHDGTSDFVRVGYAGGYSNSFWSCDVGHGGASTSAVSAIALDNTAAHDHGIYFNGSTALTYYVDGVLAATISDLTNFPTTPQSIASPANALSPVTITELFCAFNETA